MLTASSYPSRDPKKVQAKVVIEIEKLPNQYSRNKGIYVWRDVLGCISAVRYSVLLSKYKKLLHTCICRSMLRAKAKMTVQWLSRLGPDEELTESARMYGSA